ncbi:LacI family DNA-binding transcriptional regulator [Nesterenkonia aurantiaca]|uniref:LacI family DNA-binding transcriptional regulator n=1 Tax=Nesterenkonia aurantiaca TaxID=1436010 RepID=UPI003EE71F59
MTPPSSRPTMRDVAERAGVSPKTVSNVLTGTAQVREPTRLRVEQAMRELDFVPNLSARGLRNGRSGVIGLAQPDLRAAFSASMTHAVVEAAHARGLVVQVEETAAEPARERDLVTRARTHLIDGMILNPVRLQDSVVEHLDHLPPIVLIGEVEQHRTDRVFINSRSAARDAVRHLLARGARRIVALGGAEHGAGLDKATQGQRLRGYLAGLAEAELPASPELQVEVPEWTIAGGAAGMREILERGAEFDAVLAFTDSIALGAMHELRSWGARLPEDVLVCGFDDVEHASFAGTPLTTIAFDHQAYANAALDLLTSRMRDRGLPPRAQEIPYELLARTSTQGPPAGFSGKNSPI